jgi:hypothetical protein
MEVNAPREVKASSGGSGNPGRKVYAHHGAGISSKLAGVLFAVTVVKPQRSIRSSTQQVRGLAKQNGCRNEKQRSRARLGYGKSSVQDQCEDCVEDLERAYKACKQANHFQKACLIHDCGMSW